MFDFPKENFVGHRFVRLGLGLKRWIRGNLEKGIETPMAQGWSTKIISKNEWVRTSRLSIKNSLSLALTAVGRRDPIGGFREADEVAVPGRVSNTDSD